MEKRTALHEHVESLIPELAQWNNGNGISLRLWLDCIGRYDHAVAYAALFWPDFVLHDDCIFIDAPDAQNYENWMRQCGGDRRQVEAVINHRHIVDLFTNSEFEPTKQLVIHVRRLLEDMWSCKLRREFPDRHFVVECYGDGSDDLLDYQITVFQQRG
ncbi:MAG TPA: hypothetical protein VHP11_11210 [Tepidisphaeraceae bacterium]|nr:hypothetical protein [Tepidisphaeraceae bacterium]